MKYYIFLKDVNQVLFIPYSHLVTVWKHNLYHFWVMDMGSVP